MVLPFTLPDWLPWWVTIVILVPVLLLALAFLCMPFSVFGVKGRLEGVEARLDEIQGEIRSLALRLPERSMPDRGYIERGYGELDYPDRPEREAAERREPGVRVVDPRPRWAEEARPPIPPAPYPRGVEDRPPPPPTRRVDPSRGGRAEPRLDPH